MSDRTNGNLICIEYSMQFDPATSSHILNTLARENSLKRIFLGKFASQLRTNEMEMCLFDFIRSLSPASSANASHFGSNVCVYVYVYVYDVRVCINNNLSLIFHVYYDVCCVRRTISHWWYMLQHSYTIYMYSIIHIHIMIAAMHAAAT